MSFRKQNDYLDEKRRVYIKWVLSVLVYSDQVL